MSSKPHHELKILQHFNPYEEFNTDEIENYKTQFDKFDVNGDHVLDFMELKRMMEILGAPQTHVGLKDMIKEIDSDFDGTINFTEFLLIFKKARDGELSSNAGLLALARMTSIDVSQTGVSGAKDFFEMKAKILTDNSLARRASSTSTASSASLSSNKVGPCSKPFNNSANNKDNNNNNNNNNNNSKDNDNNKNKDNDDNKNKDNDDNKNKDNNNNHAGSDDNINNNGNVNTSDGNNNDNAANNNTNNDNDVEESKGENDSNLPKANETEQVTGDDSQDA